MSLDKAIEHGKEKRRKYEGAKAVDRTCRNHGSCEWCMGNRMHAVRTKEESLKAKLREFNEDGGG